VLQKERDKDESVHSNMLQYGKGSQYLDVVVADASLPLWRSSFKLDSIITDRESEYLHVFERGVKNVNLSFA
jgi:tRNA (guanine10-N2)-methyltransferase